MAVTHRTATQALSLHRRLQEDPYHFGFYRTLRLLECLYPEHARLGESLRPADDPIRLAQQPSMAFAPSTLAEFHPPAEGSPPRLEVLFLGLFGPNGPLPLHLTEYARERLRNHGDATFSRFADIFHHRMLSLFYRAWANAQPTVSLDRPESDRFGAYVGSTFGLGIPSLRARDAMPDQTKLYYAGWMSAQARNADGLCAMLGEFLGLPVLVREFVGHWMQLPLEACCRLGESPETGSLGMTATLGTQVWDCQYKFRIVLGPIGLADYERLLPGGRTLRRVVALVRNYVGDELIWDVNLVLRHQEIPPLELGRQGRLGWTTWLGDIEPERDADDLCLDPFTDAP